MERNMKTSSPAGSSFTMGEWYQLQETVIAFFSSWLAICGIPATTRRSYFQKHSRVTQWSEITPPKTQPILMVSFSQFVSVNCGAECPSDLRPCCKIVVCSCLTPQQERELMRLCSLITKHTGIACGRW